MTEIAIRDSGAPALTAAAPASVDLALWVRQADDAYQLAQRICSTAFSPKAYRGKPEEGAAAILAGAAVGLDPLASLQAFDVIEGVAAPSAKTTRAIVQSRGHEIWMVESTTDRCVMQGRRRGSQVVQEVVWTIERAKKMGLVGKKNWQTGAQNMLVARATGELSRLIGMDAILGIPYTAEEIRDDAHLTIVGRVADVIDAPPTAAELTGAPPLDVDSVRAAITAAQTVKQLREMWPDVKAAGLTADAVQRKAAIEAATTAPADDEPPDEEAERRQEQIEMESEIAADDTRGES